MYIFPAVVTKFAEDDYNVRFPDIPEIHTFGSTLEEAYEMAEDALKLHIFDLYNDGIDIPLMKPFFALGLNKLEENQILIMIKADFNKFAAAELQMAE